MGKKEKSNLMLFGLTSFFNDFGSEVIKALMPVYLQTTESVGLIGGLFDGLGEVLKYLFGIITEKVGKRKPFVVFGYALSAVSKLLIPLLSKTLLPVLVVFDRLGKGMRDSARDSMLADEKDIEKGYSIQRALDSLGTFTGILFAYTLLNLLHMPIKEIMLLGATIGFLSIIPVSMAREFSSLKKRPKDKIRLTSNIAVLFLSGLVFITPLLLAKVVEINFGYNAILAYALFAIFESIAAYEMFKFAKRVGVKGALRAAFIFAALSLLAVTYKNVYIAFGALALYGIGRGLFKAASIAYIAERVGKNPSTIGLFKTMYGLGVLISSMAIGTLMMSNLSIINYISILAVIFALLVH